MDWWLPLASDHSPGPSTPAAHGANSECTDVLKLFFKQADTPHRGMLSTPQCAEDNLGCPSMYAEEALQIPSPTKYSTLEKKC